MVFPHLSEAKRSEAQQDLSNVVAEATKDQPRRRWYELSAEGLIEAAKTCGEIATPVVKAVKTLSALLGY